MCSSIHSTAIKIALEYVFLGLIDAKWSFFSKYEIRVTSTCCMHVNGTKKHFSSNKLMNC